MTSYPASFCPYCGTGLSSRHVDGRDRQYCERCERVVWLNPVPSAGVAVVGDRGVLLNRRDIDPGRGDWNVPGGHLEVEESPREGAARELEEEVGVTVDPAALELLDVVHIPHEDGKRIVSIGFVASASDVSGSPTPGREVQAIEWFTPDSFAACDGDLLEEHAGRFERAWDEYGPHTEDSER